MWHQTYIYADPRDNEGAAPRSCYKASFVVLLTIFTLMAASLFAQSMGEDYTSMQNWELPETAVAMDDLQLEGRIVMHDGRPFEGWAFELYPEGTLLEATEYKYGQKHGCSLIWYPDGSPQMNASYRQGALHGRFLGWYQNGSLIYDRYINSGAFASDNLADQDQDRLREESEILEREGNTNDSTDE
ncbi:MAG: hypothetical protein RBR69_09920 [Candidatus Cloacimonadaceae bacterium]|jgi:antitoxin component YwqK of YwqJK toxin-antitoxin module|nr:hypothetical protein [Candidatus Cloacimonadota bacterium]MCK9243201.1 hypothetical protein [Candidatus Cloacimonadota bacterium]MDY0128435.1 hypothetical protein [Candidatus Cloacimonadaceae bacterium]